MGGTEDFARLIRLSNEQDWRLICDLCCEHELGLIYDSAMERLLFDGRPLFHPLRFEGMVERTVVGERAMWAQS